MTSALRILLLAAAAASLAACATAPATSPLSTNAVTADVTKAQVVVADAGTAIDASYNGAAKLYVAALPGMTADVKAKVKPLMLELLTCPVGVTTPTACSGYVAAADKAAAAGDSATMTADTQAAMALIQQISTILPPSS